MSFKNGYAQRLLGNRDPYVQACRGLRDPATASSGDSEAPSTGIEVRMPNDDDTRSWFNTD